MMSTISTKRKNRSAPTPNWPLVGIQIRNAPIRSVSTHATMLVSEPGGAAGGELRLDDRDAREAGEEQDREERLADDAVVVADEHPDDADERRRDERSDRDPERRAQDLAGLG
jgi:hypothetical protein